MLVRVLALVLTVIALASRSGWAQAPEYHCLHNPPGDPQPGVVSGGGFQSFSLGKGLSVPPDTWTENSALPTGHYVLLYASVHIQGSTTPTSHQFKVSGYEGLWQVDVVSLEATPSVAALLTDGFEVAPDLPGGYVWVSYNPPGPSFKLWTPGTSYSHHIYGIRAYPFNTYSQRSDFHYMYLDVSVASLGAITYNVIAWNAQVNESITVVENACPPPPCTLPNLSSRRSEARVLNDQVAADPKRKVRVPAFIHLPKTGGTTMLTILRNNGHPGKSNVTSNGLIFYGMPPIPESMWHSLVTAKDDLDYLGGHIGYADLQLVASHSTPGVDGFQFVPFTILRDPNERLLSFWAYTKDIRGIEAPLSRFLENMLPNSMYRMLAPLGSNLEDVEATMTAIKRTLKDEFVVVGLTERFDETLLILQSKGIVKDISHKRHKVLAGTRPAFIGLSEDEKNLLNDHNNLDLELYHFATELFESQVAQEGPSFAERLVTFRQQQRDQGYSDECEDDVPDFGQWMCDKEARTAARDAKKKSVQKRKKRDEEEDENSYPFRVAAALRHESHPRYW